MTYIIQLPGAYYESTKELQSDSLAEEEFRRSRINTVYAIAVFFWLFTTTLGYANQANPGSSGIVSVEPWGAEDAGSEDDSPRIPEPMVFDLMRPLGAHAGEREVNVIGLFPLSGYRKVSDPLPDALGLSGSHIEWAPEFELAIADGLALELELPFQDGSLAAYKGGVQWTIGRAMENTFIHGLQFILQYDKFPSAWLPTLTYLTGLRINRTWSMLAMTGLRGNTSRSAKDYAEGIFNLSMFADMAPEVTLGLETNLAFAGSGQLSLLLMPQIQWEATDHIMLQAGLGARIQNGLGTAEASMRLIRSF